MLDKTIANERDAVAKYEAEKVELKAELDASAETIKQLQEKAKAINDDLDVATKELEVVKKNTSKASKLLDQALKDISSKVYFPYLRLQEQFELMSSQIDRTMRLKSWRRSDHQSIGSAVWKR